MSELPGSTGVPAPLKGKNPNGPIARAVTWLDEWLRRLPVAFRQFPGLLALVGIAVVVAAVVFDWTDLSPIVTVTGTLAGVWIGQRLSADQAREQSRYTEQRMREERRANFQVRTLTEISEEIERLRDAANEILASDNAIRDDKDSRPPSDLIERGNAALQSHHSIDQRVRVLRARVEDTEIVAAIDELRRNCRWVSKWTPRQRLEGRRDGIIGQEQWDAPASIDPAFYAAMAVIGGALRDLGG